jgi:hypothetical protein
MLIRNFNKSLIHRIKSHPYAINELQVDIWVVDGLDFLVTPVHYSLRRIQQLNVVVEK